MHTAPGGIYRLATPHTAALLLPTQISGGLLHVTLLSPDIMLGTSDDLILPPAASGLPYPLLIPADICGYLPTDSPMKQHGQVSPSVLHALTALRNGDAVRHPVAGPPLLDKADPRWFFKCQELKRLHQLLCQA